MNRLNIDDSSSTYGSFFFFLSFFAVCSFDFFPKNKLLHKAEAQGRKEMALGVDFFKKKSFFWVVVRIKFWNAKLLPGHLSTIAARSSD